MITKFRASSFPRLFACHASKGVPDIAINPGSDSSALGTCVHEGLAEYVTTEAIPDLPSLALRHDVELDDLQPLFWVGKRLWDQLSPHLKVLGVEIALEQNMGDKILITGHIDILTEQGEKMVVVVDWKSGRYQADFAPQMKAYAFLSMSGKYEKAKIITCWLRTSEVEVVELTQDDLSKFIDEFYEALESNEYGPGDACTFCPKKYECPARQNMAVDTGATLQRIMGLQETEGMVIVTPEQIAELYLPVKQLKGYLDDFHNMVKEAVKNEGYLELPDGRFLRTTEVKRSTINAKGASEAMPELAEEIIEMSEVGKGKLMKMVGDSVDKGKGKARDDAWDRLVESGAAIIKTHNSLVIAKERE